MPRAACDIEMRMGTALMHESVSYAATFLMCGPGGLLGAAHRGAFVNVMVATITLRDSGFSTQRL